MTDHDEHRDCAEERYLRELCSGCGESPCPEGGRCEDDLGLGDCTVGPDCRLCQAGDYVPDRFDPAETSACPVGAACEVCGTTRGVSVYTIDVGAVGTACVTVCEPCAESGELPPMSPLAAFERVAAHCTHRGVTLDNGPVLCWLGVEDGCDAQAVGWVSDPATLEPSPTCLECAQTAGRGDRVHFYPGLAPTAQGRSEAAEQAVEPSSEGPACDGPGSDLEECDPPAWLITAAALTGRPRHEVLARLSAFCSLAAMRPTPDYGDPADETEVPS